jgi:hypothetical protein
MTAHAQHPDEQEHAIGVQYIPMITLFALAISLVAVLVSSNILADWWALLKTII